MYRLFDERRGVVNDGVLEAGREALFQLAHPGLDAVGGLEGVGAGELERGDADRRFAVEPATDVLVAGAQLDAGHVAQVGDRAGLAGTDRGFTGLALVASGLEDDILELLRRFEPAERGHRVLERLALGHGGLADLARRHLDVLFLQRLDDVGGRQPARRQLFRVDPDAHAVVLLAEQGHVADPVEPGQFVLQLNGRVVAQVELVEVRLAGGRV